MIINFQKFINILTVLSATTNYTKYSIIFFITLVVIEWTDKKVKALF